MANSEHLEKLCQGPKAWNAWRNENPQIIPDLSKASIPLSQRQFGPAEGGPVNLRAVNMEGTNLRFATLTEADLEGARLNGADLLHSKLDRAKLIATDLTDAMLDHADLTGARFARTIVVGTSFANARNFTQTQLDDTYGDGSTQLPPSLTAPQSWFPAPGTEEEAFVGYPAPEQEDEQDLYDILGLSDTASQDEIRAAYRTLVKKLHPDLNPDDRGSQEKFKLVSMAYKVLGDAEKRARYDRDEIDGEGRVRPEFEARRQFRKYAFRYYAAAALSLCLAVGVLGAVWYVVLTGGMRADTAAPGVQNASSYSKKDERLDDTAPLRMMPAGRLEVPEAEPKLPTQQAALDTAATAGARTDTASPAPASTSTPSATDAPPVTTPDKPNEAARPLGGAHRRPEAGTSQSVPARSGTTASPHGNDTEASGDETPGTAAQRESVHAALYLSERGWQDEISALCRSRAIVQALAGSWPQQPLQVTASFAAFSVVEDGEEGSDGDGSQNAEHGGNNRRAVPLAVNGAKRPMWFVDAAGANAAGDSPFAEPPRRAVSSIFAGGM